MYKCLCVCCCCCLYQNTIKLKLIIYIHPHKRSALLGEPLSAGGPPVQVVISLINCGRIPIVCLFLLDPCLEQPVSLLALGLEHDCGPWMCLALETLTCSHRISKKQNNNLYIKSNPQNQRLSMTLISAVVTDMIDTVSFSLVVPVAELAVYS